MMYSEAEMLFPAQNSVLPDPSIAVFRDTVRFWIQRVLVPILTVVGLFGNSITIVIMTRRGMRSTTNMYLAALAFVDMLYLVLTFLLGLSHYPNMAQPEYYYYWRMKPFLMMLCDVSSNTSVWLTVTFTIERYIAVEYPIKGKVWCTEARAKLLIIFVIAFSLLFALPVPFEWELVKKPVIRSSHISADGSMNYNEHQSSAWNHDNSTGSFTWALENSDFGKNETYKFIYYRSTAVIFYIIPIILLVYFNIRLCQSVHASKRHRDNMIAGTAHRGEKRSTCSVDGGTNKSHYQNLPTVIIQTPANGKSITLNVKGNRHKTRDSLSATPSRDDLTDEGLINQSIKAIEPAAKESFSNSDATIGLSVSSDSNVHATNCDNNNQAADRLVEICNDFSGVHSSDESQATSHKEVEPRNSKENVNTIESNPLKSSPTSKGSPRSVASTSACGSSVHHHSGGSTNHSTQERRITIMLIAVVILFLLCQLPSAIMILYTSTQDLTPNSNEHALVLAFNNIFNFMMAVNAACNFILYSLLSKKYRRTFVRLFCNCFRTKYKAVRNCRTPFSVRFEAVGQSSCNNNVLVYQLNKTSEKRSISRSDTSV